MSKRISDLLPETEILAQLAEEASESAQAVLKLRRNCIYTLEADDIDVFELYVVSYWQGAYEKHVRWLTRLEERERKKDE